MSQLLIEMLVRSQLNESAGADKATLINTPEYKELEKADLVFAKNLAMAWEGDAKEYVKTQGKSKDLLFPLMFKKNYLANKGKRVAELPDFDKIASTLSILYKKTFPEVPKDAWVDTSVWSDVKWKRAYEAKFNETEYELLKEELLKL